MAWTMHLLVNSKGDNDKLAAPLNSLYFEMALQDQEWNRSLGLSSISSVELRNVIANNFSIALVL
jgi:hypothetical protein